MSDKNTYQVTCPRCGVEHTTEYEWIGALGTYRCKECAFDSFMDSIFKFGAD
ncbi:MAG: hypothetical protein ACO3VQ_08475 [Ilumatobacteraceae bacterium]